MEFDIGHADCWIHWNDPIIIFVLIFTCIWNAGAHWYIGRSGWKKFSLLLGIESLFFIHLCVVMNALIDGIVWYQHAKWPDAKMYIMVDNGFIILLCNLAFSLAGFFLGRWQRRRNHSPLALPLNKIYILELLMPGWGFVMQGFVVAGVLLAMGRAILFYLILKHFIKFVAGVSFNPRLVAAFL